MMILEKHDSNGATTPHGSGSGTTQVPARLLAALLLFGVVGADASAAFADSCTVKKASSGSTGASVGLHVPLRFPGGAGEKAVAIWERCHELGIEVPEVRLRQMAADNLVVRYSRQSEGTGRCGMIEGRLITIYAYARDARGRALDCGPPAVNLAHEIGHFLGLRDIDAAPPCRTHLMAGVTRHHAADRTVDAEICSAVSSLWRRR